MTADSTNKDVFTHKGYISRIKASSVIVALEPNLDCASCHARGACGAMGASDKKIEVYHSDISLNLNEEVEVYLKKTTGLKAVFWAYIFPFILMFLTLVIASLFFDEGIAGLLSLFILLPYYLTLYFLKDKLKTPFRVSILKL
jgi:positive regulator of sigma E activity